MSQAQYARHRDKSPQYIGKLAKAGILVMRGRMVDAVASDAVLDDKPDDPPGGPASSRPLLRRPGWPAKCSPQS